MKNINNTSQREVKRTPQEKESYIRRINKIAGQVNGISKMIEDDRYCSDILIQISAANSALKSLGNELLSNHMKTCIVTDIKNGNEEVIDEVMEIIKRLSR